ncbi:MAG: DUF302 domain-containing protein [Gammaproteobacteria bacterium]|nr:DUF302 domain-containing protein [Gammaproteobacteria bacterium]
MGVIRNLLALIGLLVIIGVGYGYATYQPMIAKLQAIGLEKLQTMMARVDEVGIEPMMGVMEKWDIAALIKLGDELDPKALEVYQSMMDRLIETRNTADATVWKVPVEEGLTVEDVELSMKNIANEHNIKAVGELPLSEQVKLMTGEEQRFLKIYMYCNPLTAMKMVEHSDAYSAYLPCRIAMIKDKTGKLWLYALDMDMMIWGGATLPDFLKEEALKVRFVIKDIMQRAAAGDF